MWYSTPAAMHRSNRSVAWRRYSTKSPHRNRTDHAEQLFGDQALQIRARVGLDRDHLARAGAVAQVTMPAFQWAKLQHSPSFDAAQRPQSPTEPAIFEEMSLSRAKFAHWRREPRRPLALMDVEGELR
jgi:hypothetical protein